MIQDYAKLAFGNLRKRKLRSWLTIIGIFIAVATITVLISLSIGLQQAVTEQFQILGSDKFFIMPKGQAGAPGSGGAVELTTEDVNIIEKVQGVKEISYFVAGNVKIEFGGKSRYYMVVGMPKDKVGLFEEATALDVDEGKNLKKAKKNEIIIGSLYKTGNLFKRPIKAGDKVKLNDVEVRVLGILKSVGNPQDDQNIYMLMDTFEEIFGKTDRVDEIMVQVQPGEDIKQVADKVETKLMKFRNVDEKSIDFSILTPEELLASFGTILNILTSFLLSIGAISVIVGAVGIMNTMYTSVLERTSEIGTMKAIGARNSDILYIFLIESGLLGLVGGIFGIILGIVAGKGIEYYAASALGSNILRASFPWYLVLGALLFGFIIGSISGLLPAMQASRLKPVDALRYE